MEINYLAILVAAVAAMLVGGFWYSPVLFGKPWMREMGKNPDDMKGIAFPLKEMAIQFIASLVLAFVLALFIYRQATVGEAVTLALWIWVGFYVTLQLNSVLWEGRSWKLYFINIAQSLVTLVLMAVVIGLWL